MGRGPRGAAPALGRTVVIISTDSYTRSDLHTVTVAALTTNGQLAGLPGNVAVAASVSAIESDSIVNVTQMATIEDRIGALSDWPMARIDAKAEAARPLACARFPFGARASAAGA